MQPAFHSSHPGQTMVGRWEALTLFPAAYPPQGTHPQLGSTVPQHQPMPQAAPCRLDVGNRSLRHAAQMQSLRSSLSVQKTCKHQEQGPPVVWTWLVLLTSQGTTDQLLGIAIGEKSPNRVHAGADHANDCLDVSQSHLQRGSSNSNYPGAWAGMLLSVKLDRAPPTELRKALRASQVLYHGEWSLGSLWSA